MSDNKVVVHPGFCTILFMVFLVLKLTNTIDWSWWWITAPLWIPLGLALSIFLMVVVVFWILDLVK